MRRSVLCFVLAALAAALVPAHAASAAPGPIAPPPGARVVNSGAFCAGGEAGDIAQTITGLAMVCVTTPSDSRLRWRALDPTETPVVGSVYRLYQAYFLRDPDTGGMYYWIEQYGGGVSLSAVSNAFVISNEFVGRYGELDVPNFVRLVYLNVLGREPDPDGYNHWAGLLAFGGLPAANMMIGFSESPEYRSMTGTA